MKFLHAAVFTVTCTLSLLPQHAAAQSYRIEDLGVSTFDSITGLNGAGQVAGTLNDRAILLSNGVAQMLPSLPDATPSSYTLGITGNQIVGAIQFPSTTDLGWRATLWQSGTPYFVGSLGGDSYATGVAGNVVVGYGTTVSGATHAFAVRGIQGVNQTMTDLGTLGGTYSQATGVDNQGRIVGTSLTAGGVQRAFVYRNGVMSAAGPAGSVRSALDGVTQNGMAFGTAIIQGVTQAFTLNLDTDQTTMLGSNFKAIGANIHGALVGQAGTAFGPAAALYEGGQLLDLNLADGINGSGWQLSEANDINQFGQIVGTGVLGGQVHAFLLTPVPEPSQWAMLMGGLVVLAARVRRRSATPTSTASALTAQRPEAVVQRAARPRVQSVQGGCEPAQLAHRLHPQ